MILSPSARGVGLFSPAQKFPCHIITIPQRLPSVAVGSVEVALTAAALAGLAFHGALLLMV